MSVPDAWSVCGDPRCWCTGRDRLAATPGNRKTTDGKVPMANVPLDSLAGVANGGLMAAAEFAVVVAVGLGVLWRRYRWTEH